MTLVRGEQTLGSGRSIYSRVEPRGQNWILHKQAGVNSYCCTPILVQKTLNDCLFKDDRSSFPIHLVPTNSRKGSTVF